MQTVVPDVINLSAVGLPAAAATSVEFAGCAFIATALAHVLRRVLFHRVDLPHLS